MKIAIPMADGQLCMHFGHCEQFALVEVDDAAKTITGTTYLTPPAHEPGVLPAGCTSRARTSSSPAAWASGHRACSRRTASRWLSARRPRSPRDVSAYLAGTLEAGQNVCDH